MAGSITSPILPAILLSHDPTSRDIKAGNNYKLYYLLLTKDSSFYSTFVIIVSVLAKTIAANHH